ncbi:hypothetical protein ACFOLA_05475 [Salinicoccus hispanicus]|nr:hypothetical protein [Salinicoccus hispanicus]
MHKLILAIEFVSLTDILFDVIRRHLVWMDRLQSEDSLLFLE